MRSLPWLPVALLSITACSGQADLGPQDGSTPTDVPDSADTADTGVPTDTGTVSLGACDAIDFAGEGALLSSGPTSAAVSRCTERLHAVVMAATSRHELHLDTWVSDAPATLEVRDWNGLVLGEVAGLEQGDVVPLEASWSGEHALVVRADDGSAADYTLSVACLEGCDLQTTRYPVLFMHGMAGTESFFDVLDYWYDVVPTLTAAGYGARAASVDPFQPTPIRSEGWSMHLEALFVSGEARRVNLIGHSQGGLDARYLAAALDPDGRIRSVTTVATPHRGAAAADVAHGLVDGSIIGEVLFDALFDELAGLYGLTSDQDIVAQTLQLTTGASADFNNDVPDRTDIPYYSWAGVTCDLLDLLCQADQGGEIVDPLLAITHVVTSLLEGPNDGLVSVESATWGTYLGPMPADHLDQVGQLPGTTAPGFDHRQFYLDEAARLAAEGL